MSDITTHLLLPYILASQAQKHVTHNEALRVLDVLVQPVVASRSTPTPPPFPAEAVRFIVPAGATGAWSGQDGAIALREAEAWVFVTPQPGWQAQVLDEGRMAVFDGTLWQTTADLPQEFPRLGISTSADATSRLAVSAPATLLTHDGAGHQLKINKATPADTASLLFQTGFSGRAEMGTAGSDDFSIKVSPDGSTWTTALTLAAASGQVQMGQGLVVTGALSGTAVMQSATDATAGRLLALSATQGAFGLGAAYGPQLANLDATSTPGGLYFFNIGGGTTGTSPGFNAGSVLVMHSIGAGVQAPVQIALERTASAGRLAWRNSQGGVWGAWRTALGRGEILGTVSQSGGVPTGALMETGSNANGRYYRYADGRQVCEHGLTAASGATTADGALFRSGNISWTYPAVFVGGTTPQIYGESSTLGCFVACGGRSNTVTSNVRLYSTVSTGSSTTFNIRAEGRWFA